MPLGPGVKLGPYEVLAPLGSGGMGEVYRARDTRLGRTVAIKVLPSHLSSNLDLRARFEREAKAVSSLNHPHICVLHDIGQQDGIDYLVLEYLEGESLHDRLEKGPLPLDQALRYATEIADALDKAHRHGIVHRDLKPGNVMVTKAGSKLMDFGLARTAKPVVSSDAELSALATTAKPLTEKGTLLGTVQYMAPEQIEGGEADARTDLWALGALLYEMVTGKRAFVANSPASLIGAILKDEPRPIRELKPLTPPSLERLVKTCLTKDPDERWQSAHDVVSELRWIAESASAAGGAPATTAVTPSRSALLWTLAALGVAGWLLALWAPLRRSAAPLRPMQVNVELGADVSLDVTGQEGSAAILSPDGSLLAFVAREKENERPRLYLQRLDRLTAAPLPGTEGAHNPFFSPDAQWIAFFADGQVKRVAVGGGATVVLASAPTNRGGSWSEDGTILFTPNGFAGVGLSRVSASQGRAEVLTRPDPAAGEATHRWPQALPGGKAVLFTANRVIGGYEGSSIVVQQLPDGPRKIVVRGGYHGRYLLSGHVVYMHEGTLFAIPFDLARLEVTGTAVPVIEGLMASAYSAGAQFAFSNQGTFVYLRGRDAPMRSIQWLDGSGRLSPLRATPSSYINVFLSPDGTRLASTVYDGNATSLWVFELARGTKSRLTFEDNRGSYPVWSPDGRRVVYTSTRDGQIYWQRADGTGSAQLLVKGAGAGFRLTTSWHPSGKYLALQEPGVEAGFDVFVVPVEGDAATGLKAGEPTAFLNSSFNEWQAAFSPDGQWLAYSSNEAGRDEVYVRPFPGPGGTWQVSTEGGSWPTWSRKSSEIFYEALDGRLMVASYEARGETFNVARPRLWSETRVLDLKGLRTFDLHPDGQRFAVVQRVAGEPRRNHVVLYENFFDELRRFAPTR